MTKLKTVTGKIRSFFSTASAKAYLSARNAAESLRDQAEDTRAEGYVDTGVKILIAVVIGGLLLTLLYTLFADEVFPTLSQKIQTLFGYTGSGN